MFKLRGIFYVALPANSDPNRSRRDVACAGGISLTSWASELKRCGGYLRAGFSCGAGRCLACSRDWSCLRPSSARSHWRGVIGARGLSLRTITSLCVSSATSTQPRKYFPCSREKVPCSRANVPCSAKRNSLFSGRERRSLDRLNGTPRRAGAQSAPRRAASVRPQQLWKISSQKEYSVLCLFLEAAVPASRTPRREA